MQIGSHAKQLFQFFFSGYIITTIMAIIICNKHSITPFHVQIVDA